MEPLLNKWVVLLVSKEADVLQDLDFVVYVLE
jgi:hypothetical protein